MHGTLPIRNLLWPRHSILGRASHQTLECWTSSYLDPPYCKQNDNNCVVFHVTGVCLPSQSASKKHNQDKKAHKPLHTSWILQTNMYRTYSNKRPPLEAQKINKRPPSNKCPSPTPPQTFCTSPAHSLTLVTMKSKSKSKSSEKCRPDWQLLSFLRQSMNCLYCLCFVHVRFCTLFCLVEAK